MHFSSQFKHRQQHDPYDILMPCPATGTDVCKTSFREHQVRAFLHANENADEIMVKEVLISGKKYFALQARQDGSDINTPLIGDLPCPDECIPPGYETNSSFDFDHVQDVIDVTHCLWLQVHRSRPSDAAAFNHFSIYALTDDGQGGLVNEWNNGDIMFTTI
jgi:hypothetical protein